MEIKYNVRERAWLGVTVAETWIFDLGSKYVHEDRMPEVEVCVKLTLVPIWTFADKIRSQSSEILRHARNIIENFNCRYVVIMM